MNIIKSVWVGFIVILLMTTAVSAQPSEERGGKEKWRAQEKEKFFKELNLTPQQQEKIEENRQAQRDAMVKARTAMEEKRARLQEAMKDPAVTKATVEPLVNDMKALQAQMIDGRIDGIFAVKQILTAEQFVQFQQMMEKRKKKGKDRLGKKCQERKEHHEEE